MWGRTQDYITFQPPSNTPIACAAVSHISNSASMSALSHHKICTPAFKHSSVSKHSSVRNSAERTRLTLGELTHRAHLQKEQKKPVARIGNNVVDIELATPASRPSNSYRLPSRFTYSCNDLLPTTLAPFGPLKVLQHVISPTFLHSPRCTLIASLHFLITCAPISARQHDKGAFAPVGLKAIEAVLWVELFDSTLL